jgi:2',3'-cyclic-nucleotide 2'-phosphodiesterase (5'-nucleotidase family)/predicted AlkP superfamily pyrophosphatase or phosphodiesterase
MTATARPTARALVLIVVAALLGAMLTVATRTNPAAAAKPKQPVLLFVADGMRQDIIARYAAEKNGVPTLARLLKDGASATDGGMRTQAPPNTGSGWFTIATGAWPGVHGSTNNTFHVNGQPFGNSTSALGSPNVLQAESIAQSAERAGKKVAQIEYAGGRASAISGPTVDFRTFLSGRGVVTNYISPSDDAPFVQAFNLQFDHPAGFSNQPPFPAATPVPATEWTGVPNSFSPAMETHMRVIDFGTDKYGLNAYIYDSTDDNATNYDRVLFSRTKSGADAVGDLREGEWADVKVTVVGGNLAGLTAGFLIKVEELAPDLSQYRLFHTSVTRAIASWPTWPGSPGFTGDFAEFLAQTFPTSTAADFAVLEAGIVSEETYAEQGLYWATGHHPIIEYILKTYQPDLALVGVPVVDEFSHQFMGLVSPTLPGGAPNPAFDDVLLDGVPDGRVAQREAFIRSAYEEADDTLELAQNLLAGKKTTTFVGSDHGFAPQFLALDASKPLVDLGLLSRPQTGNCRPATGETIGKAKACWAGGALQIYLNLAGRDPAGGGFTQVLAAEEAATVQLIRDAYTVLADPNDWTGDGAPESWKVIDRTYTKAEARYIPNGTGTTTDMAHPTRTGDLVVFSYPPYQFDAATPGTRVSPSHFFGQHGYVPDVQDLANNINMRATFIAGGQDIKKGQFDGVRAIDIAPTIAYVMHIPEPQHSQGRVLIEITRKGQTKDVITIVGLNDFHGQLDPTTRLYDGLNIPVGGGAILGTLFDEEKASNGYAALVLAGGDNVGASPPNSGLLQDMPAIDVENAWPLDATSYGNHEFDYGVDRLLMHQDRANFPFLGVNIVDEATGERPDWVTPSVVFDVGGKKIGVIGAALESTPELVSAGATEGLDFLPAAPAIHEESERLRKNGVKIQIVVIHEGTINGANAVGAAPAVPWDGPIVPIAQALQDTTIDAIVAGHTHRVSNVMVGNILVTEGINAGASYSVLQLVVPQHDVEWVGGATRYAKTLGVRPRADVQAIVTQANADTAVLRNQVIGTQTADILRDPARKAESAMGNLVTDAMLAKYPGVEAALTNSGGLRQDLLFSPPSANEQPGEITWGEVFAVLPFGNRTTIMTLTHAQLVEALLNGVSPVCNVAVQTGRFPQIAGMRFTYTCNSTTPVITNIWKVPPGGGPEVLMGPGDTIRLVTNDFMAGGGDGYTMLTGGTDVLQPGDALLDVVVDAITANSPVTGAIHGRITGP